MTMSVLFQMAQASGQSICTRSACQPVRKTGYKGLSRFIAMIDRALANDKDLADVQEFLPQNAVQLMTIHKSKGLEFKYVFLMNIDKRFNLEDHYQSVIISRKNGLGIQYLADMKDKVNSPLPQVRVLMNTLPYQNNLQELKLPIFRNKCGCFMLH